MCAVGINVVQDEDVFVVVARCDWVASTQVMAHWSFCGRVLLDALCRLAFVPLASWAWAMGLEKCV